MGSFLDDILTSVHGTPGSVAACSSSETCPPPISVTKLISMPDKPNPSNTNGIKRQNIHTVRGVGHMHWTPSLTCQKQTKTNIKQPGVQDRSSLSLETGSTITFSLLHVSPDVRTSQNNSLISTVLSNNQQSANNPCFPFASVCKFAVVTVWGAPGPPNSQNCLPHIELFAPGPPNCGACPCLAPVHD